MSEIQVSADNSVVVISEQVQTAVVSEGSAITVEVGTPTVIVSGLIGPPGVSELGLLRDVDTSRLSDGGILIYEQATQKWTATNTLERQILEGGQF